MRYFRVTAKLGHVGKNNYYKGVLFIYAESKKDAAKYARQCPRVKHDRKDAILSVEEIDENTYRNGRQNNSELCYFTCYNIQEQRIHICEIEDSVFHEDWVENEQKKYSKKHSLRKSYNVDPDYEIYKNKKNIDCFVA